MYGAGDTPHPTGHTPNRVVTFAHVSAAGSGRETSAEGARWWDEPDVVPLSSGAKLLRHEAIGEVRLEHLVLTAADDPEQKLVTFRTPSGDDAILRRLLS
jgi:hypothetical protein